MPHRILQILGLVSAIDWKAFFVFVGAAAVVPTSNMPLWIEALVRLLIPIVGGIIWVFLKPKVIGWKNRKRRK